MIETKQSYWGGAGGEAKETESVAASVVAEAATEAAGNATAAAVQEFRKVSKSVARASPEQLEAWRRQGFTSCVIATLGVEPTAAVRRLLPLLAPSATFAVFSTALQPLSDCMQVGSWCRV